ncbi:helix-turn-helix transcriptional regulator [Sandaracinus amylolyticus]|uniref:helix-turn-helix transcriptional regulator n=1 Tax=Sandaracinus amylolyticus TaxID=927083 RepID=UPI001F45E6C7|nr:AraC family transcriptional regulator [Sandaracinus amylolyticus]UJR80171.1 HTH araC/xylS-type domain-containing protein [Sandaracinus amylolyticus]
MQDTLRRLIEELAVVGAELTRGPDVHGTPSRLAAATCISMRTALYVGTFKPPRSLVVALLEGTKTVEQNAERFVAATGDLFIAPAGILLGVDSRPDPDSGCYRAVVIDLDPDAVAAVVRRHPTLHRGSSVLGPFDPTRAQRLPASPHALQAVLHFVRTLMLPDAHAALLQHRLEDLVLALALQQVGDLEPERAHATQARLDLVLAVRNLIRGDPAAPWPAELVARRLAVSAATLRRRLATAGLTLREVRAQERMALARTLLSRPGANVSEVAQRCGYQSASKFARQYRRWTGSTPSQRALHD